MIDSKKSIMDLVDDHGYWCREVGYLDAATRTPFPQKEHMESLEYAVKMKHETWKAIAAHVSQDVYRQVKAAEEGSANVLRAVLAGVVIGERKKGEADVEA